MSAIKGPINTKRQRQVRCSKGKSNRFLIFAGISVSVTSASAILCGLKNLIFCTLNVTYMYADAWCEGPLTSPT